MVQKMLVIIRSNQDIQSGHAYASGALVKCRKVGAANWGNSSKKEEFEPTGISFQQFSENVGRDMRRKV